MTKCAVFPVIDLPATGRRIEKSRKAAGLSVKDVQTYFGFEYPQAVYKWQHGECLPSVDNLLALSRLFETPMEDLLVYEDQEVFHVFWGSRDTFAECPRTPEGGVPTGLSERIIFFRSANTSSISLR